MFHMGSIKVYAIKRCDLVKISTFLNLEAQV